MKEKYKNLVFATFCSLPGLMAIYYVFFIYFYSKHDFGNARHYIYTMQYQNVFSVLSMLLLGYGLCQLFKAAKESYIVRSICVDNIKVLEDNIWLLALACLFIWSFLATFMAEDVALSLSGSEVRNEGLFTYIIYFLVFTVALTLRNEKWRRLFFYCISASAIPVVLVLLLQDNNEFFPAFFYIYEEPPAIFTHYNHTGYFLNFALLAAVGLYYFEKKRALRVFLILCMVIQYVGLVVNDTFGPILAAIITVLLLPGLYFLAQRKLSARITVPIAVMAIITLLNTFGVIPIHHSEDTVWTNFTTMTSDVELIASDIENAELAGHGRVMVWSYFFDLTKKHPIVGYGPDANKRFRDWENATDRPANEFLGIAYMLGYPALCFYLIALITLAVWEFKHIKELNQTTMIAAGCVITYLISAMFGNSTYYITYMYFMCLGFICPEFRIHIKEK